MISMDSSPRHKTLNNRPVAGLPVLASYLKSAITSGNADGTIIALPRDVIGYSPPSRVGAALR